MIILVCLMIILQAVALVMVKYPTARRIGAYTSYVPLTVLVGLLLANVASKIGELNSSFVFDGTALFALIYVAFSTHKLALGRVVYRKLYFSSLRGLLWLWAALTAAIALSQNNVDLPVYYMPTISIALSSVLLVSAIRNTRRSKARPAKHHITDKTAPAVSILVPARDETEELLDCLDSLVELDYPKLEILVLDDCSENKRTAEIIKQFAHKGVRFIAGSQPKGEWLGKNNAYQSLLDQSTGEYLIFMGADVRLHKHTVRNVLDRIVGTNIEMVSVMPLRTKGTPQNVTAPLRYFWELALPRKLLKKPPVLSSFWLIKADKLKAFGGFKGVSRSMIPERHIAKFIGPNYRFWFASQLDLNITTSKILTEQTHTALLQRYPQSKRRIERVGLYTLLLLLIAVLPLLLIFYSPALSIVALMLLSLALIVSEQAVRESHVLRGILATSLIIQEIYLLNYSMLKYEFSHIYWKNRNVCLPVMRVYKSLPKL